MDGQPVIPGATGCGSMRLEAACEGERSRKKGSDTFFPVTPLARQQLELRGLKVVENVDERIEIMD